MEKYPVTIGLHGFWGRPEDWNAVQDFFPHLFVAKDLYENEDVLNLNLPEAARQWGLRQQKKYPDGVCLAGYSMGGRFALHVASFFPLWVKGLSLLSTHPGGLTTEEIRTRKQWVGTWQKNFNELSLKECLKLWQDQETFKQTKKMSFRQDLRAETLSQNIDKWSLMNHQMVLKNLDLVSMPQIWLFGEDDVRFQKVAKSLRLAWPNRKVIGVKNAGHRLLLDAPDVVAEALKEILNLSLQRGKTNEIEIH